MKHRIGDFDLSEPSVSTLLLEEFLPYRLSALSNRVSQSLADKYSQRFQISVQEWRIIAVLGEKSDLCAGDLVTRTAMDKVAVSRAVKKLIHKAYLAKIQDPQDNRRHALSLSESGQSLYQEIVPLALEYEQQILAGLSERDQKSLSVLLDKLDKVPLIK